MEGVKMIKYVLYTKYADNSISFEIAEETITKNKTMFPKGKDWIVECFENLQDATQSKFETIEFVKFLNIGNQNPLKIIA